MRGVFLLLSAVTLLAQLAAAGVGFYSARFGHGPRSLHVYLGLLAGILTALVHCLFIFYLIGTGAYVKKMTQESRALWDRFVPVTKRIKAEGHPVSFLTMLFTVAAAITGGGVDTGKIPSDVHFLLFVVAIPLNAIVFARQVRLADRNRTMMREVIAETGGFAGRRKG
jgi:hypothetical protein